MGDLRELTHASLRALLGDFCAINPKAEAGTTAAQDIRLVGGAQCVINGVYQTAIAANTEPDLSAATFLDGNGNSASNAVLATAYTQKWIVGHNGSAYVVIAGTAVANGSTAEYPEVPAGVAPICGIQVVNTSGSNFTLGTTSFATGGITDTYEDLAAVPV